MCFWGSIANFYEIQKWFCWNLNFLILKLNQNFEIVKFRLIFYNFSQDFGWSSSSNPHNLKLHLQRKHSPLTRKAEERNFSHLRHTKPIQVLLPKIEGIWKFLFSWDVFGEAEIVSSVNTHTDSFWGPISLAHSYWSRSSSPSDRSGAFSLLVTNAIVENFLHRTAFSWISTVVENCCIYSFTRYDFFKLF